MNAFCQGFAIIARNSHGDVLRSFYGTKEYAASVLHRTIDTLPLRVEKAEVSFCDNGNIRIWRLANKTAASPMLSTGKKRVLGAVVTISANEDGSIQIDRIEVPKEHQRKGLATKALKQLADEARRFGVNLSASICPDTDTKNFAITDGLRRALSRAGFTPLEMDGEVYRNDVELRCHTPAVTPA
jgi:GNAT superfamily N-acetyltransferase